jgi:transposase-like protein
MANTERDSGRERFWRAAVARQTKGGRTVRAFCREEKLQESAFYFWRRTIAERDAKRSVAAAPAFVPVVLSDRRIASPAEIAIEIRGGRVLRISDSIPADRLAAIVLALEATEVQA